MKLHLPVLLRKALLACFSFAFAYSGTAAAADLLLGGDDSLTIDYANADSIRHLGNGTLQLNGDTILLLSNCGEGDGKTYTLFTGVSGLVDAEGYAITLNSSNNAISNYFDATQPGTGFWANATLQLSPDGTLQLVRHTESVKDEVTITTRQSGYAHSYKYYTGVEFKDISSSSSYGGAIYGYSSYFYYYTITLSYNGSVTFSGNTASSYGGAIYGDEDCSITLSNNGSVTFSGNDARYGGAIYGYSGSTITLNGNGSVTFSENTASSSSSYSSYGGAIYGRGDITLSNNGSVTFSGNEARYSSYYSYSSYGGAIYGEEYCSIRLSNNGSVTFSGNDARYGGAIYGYSGSPITLSYNGSVTFSGNEAGSYGGAIYGYSGSTITLSNNGSVTFSGNTATSYGGAIYGSGDITLSNNDSVTFSGNTASSYGGAIYGYSGSTITLSGNGSVTFSGNSGGAIDGITITLSDNESVTFSGNSGGAIYAYGNLSIRNNESVLFEKNKVISNGTYRLRSIYAGGSGDVISLSAAEDKSIEFRDSIYISSGSTVKFNADYTDADGEVHAQKGDIIFTGATTAADLQAVKGSSGTVEEIRNSRTSEVRAMTNLYGGRLRVEDGAIYQGYGITAMAESGATVRVKDATLSHEGYQLTLQSGTTLELEGENELRGNVSLLRDSALRFVGAEKEGVTTIYGDLMVEDAIQFSLSGMADAENKVLIWVKGDVSGWDNAYITSSTDGYSASDLTLIYGFLVLNYNESSFNPYLMGDYTADGCVTQKLELSYYDKVLFDYINGGAVDSDSLTLCFNNSVLFNANSLNSASSSVAGGAINSSDFVIDQNNSVTFRGNTVTCTAEGYWTYNQWGQKLKYYNRYADGGAINGSGVLSGNGSVLFTRNAVTAEDVARGGAVYVGSSLTLSGNDKLEFSRNTSASTLSSYGGAMYAGSWDTVNIVDNGAVLFSMNSTASSSKTYERQVWGGAIYGDSSALSIRNNASVVFEKNAEKQNGNYHLRSIYVTGSSSNVSFSAAAGQKIEFRDSIYVSSDNALKLNEDYEGLSQTGDIIFTGVNTAADLKEMKNGVEATETELNNSRTSEIYTMTKLYGGRLIVEKDAVYECDGITAMAGSASTVLLRNGSIIRTDTELKSQLTFHRGTTLSLVGINTIASEQLTMMDGSTWIFNVSAENVETPVLTYSGLLAQRGILNIQINSTEQLKKGEYKLLNVTHSVGNWWIEEDIIINGGALTMDCLQWEDNTLYFTYTGQDIPNLPDEPVIPDDPIIPDNPVDPDDPVIPDAPVVSQGILAWSNEKKAVWQVGARGWKDSNGKDAIFSNGNGVTLADGTATIVGNVAPGEVVISPTKSLTLKSDKKDPGSITGDASVTITGGDKVKVTMNEANSYKGGTIIKGTTVTAKGNTSFGTGAITLSGGTLNLGGKEIKNAITLSGAATIKSGKKYMGAFTMTGGELMKGSQLDVKGAATLSGGTLNGALSGTGTLNINGAVTLGDSGKLTTNELNIAEAGKLTVGAKGLAMNAKTSDININGGTLHSDGKLGANNLTMLGGKLNVHGAKPQAITFKGAADIVNAELDFSGKFTAASLSAMNADIALNNWIKPQSIALTGKGVYNELTNSNLYADGSMKVAGDLALYNSGITLVGGWQNKPMALNVNGKLTLGSGSSLTLSGALSATDLTLNGGTINLIGPNAQTIKVKQSFTLNDTVTLNVSFGMQRGKAVKLITFKSTNLTTQDDLNSLLGIGEEYCTLELDAKGTSILLTVDDEVKWNNYLTENYEESTRVADINDEGDEAEQSGTSSGGVTTGEADAALSKVSDTLVQSTWGAAKASRAFVDSIGKRRQNATALDAAGRGAAWGAALGATARLSSHGGHNGADYNLSGAAFGVETAATGKHSVGLAIGSTWGKVSTLSAYSVDQDSTHVALYGQSRMGKGLSLDWSAAYGRSENEADLLGAGYDWTQHSVQLDARLSYGVALNERTTARAFAGLQYQHVDSATPAAGVEADSLSNLRAEIGVGAGYAATAKTSVYGEVSFIGDMVRDNPATHIGGTCRSGANPGRAGMNLSVGATHALNESWSVNAGYTLELVPHATGHNANIGATYRF